MSGPRRPSIAREDYLQTILQLDEENVPVIQARLVERLEVSPPSVSEAIRSLEDDGLVEVVERKRISLTDSGREQAEKIVRRHRVAERILTDLLSLPWHEAHLEAHRLEHGLSDRVVDAALEVLGHPTTCPHGSPIPGSAYVPGAGVTLDTVATGTPFRIDQVGEEVEYNHDVLQYLGENGFVPGIEAAVTSVAPDGTRSVVVAGRTIAVAPVISRHIFVTPG